MKLASGVTVSAAVTIVVCGLLGFLLVNSPLTTRIDRPLTHINKKGRPVTQCAHCRGLRKSRTTHVKCECGDKKKKSLLDSDKGDLKREHAGDAPWFCILIKLQRILAPVVAALKVSAASVR